MSGNTQIRPLLTINTLEEIIQQYPVDSSIQSQPLFRNLRSELKEKTTFFIAEQLYKIRTALSLIFALLLLSTISIAKVIVGARLSDQCPFKPQIAVYLIVQGAHVFLLIIAPIILILFYLSVAAARRASLFVSIQDHFYLASIVINGVFLLFRIGWSTMAQIWLNGNSGLQFTDSTLLTYCHQTLYWFSLASAAIHLFSVSVLFFLVSMTLMKKLKHPTSIQWRRFQKIYLYTFGIFLIISIYV